MQKPNSSDNARRSCIDNREKPPTTQDACCVENVQVLLEVEVIESLHPSMSRDEENFGKQIGLVEVMIIRPGGTNTVDNLLQNSGTSETIREIAKNSNELEYRGQTDRRPVSSVTDRRHISNHDKRQNKSFVVGNTAGGPAMKMEIVGDLPSKVNDTVLASVNNLRHGDHCNEKAVAAELLKSYVNFCNSGTEVRGTPPLPCTNTLVHRVNLEETVPRNYPLVEFSAAQKILDTYAPDGSSRHTEKHQIIDVMRNSLAEWGSDEKRVTNTLGSDDSALTRCEHCGVISFKKSLISCRTSVPKTIEKSKRCRKTENTNSVCYANTLGACDHMSRNGSEENYSGSKSSVTAQNELEVKKTRIGGDPDELILRQPQNDYIGSPSAVDRAMPEREAALASECTKEVTDFGLKKTLKTVPPSSTTKDSRHSASVETKEKSYDSRFRNTSFSRQLPKRGVPKPVEKLVRNTRRGSGNRKNVDPGNNKTNSQSSETKAQICNINMNDDIASNTPAKAGANDVTNCEASLLQDSTLRNRFPRSLVPPSNIPAKLEESKSVQRTSSNNSTKCSDRRSIENESQLKDNLRLWMNEASPTQIFQEVRREKHADLDNPPRNLPHSCTVSSDERSFADLDPRGNNRLSISDSYHRSLRDTKNCEPHRINCNLHHSAPLISSTKEASANEDLAIDRYLADNSSPTRYNGESETTGFSSSSSENVIREWANLLAQDLRVDRNPLTVKSKGEAMGGIQSLRTQIDNAIGNSATHTAPGGYQPYSRQPLKNPDKTLNLDSPAKDFIAKSYDRFKNTDCHYFSSDPTALPFSFSKDDHSSEQKYVANKTPMTHAFDESSKNSLSVTYKNVASTISSNSDYCKEDYYDFDFRGCPMRSRKDDSISELNESEIFERQIKYDEISSKDISTGSKENLEAKILPVYRKILESKDEMDWKTFQQLVGTLHPSQRELWCDICRAVSNEAKRVAGETGASTEVCIEINPVPTSQTFNCEQRSRVKTSGNEISFEMDMILTDSETFFDQKSQSSSKAL